MAIFKTLNNIGITRWELAKLNEKTDLVRIEKLLNAEQKLNNNVSKNEVAQIMEVITHYPDVIREICSLNCFYNILLGNGVQLIDDAKTYEIEQLARIKLVVSKYFMDELTEYFNINLKTSNWIDLRILLFYRIFFDTEVFKVLTKKLEAKFEYSFTLLNDKPNEQLLRDNLGFLKSPQFYLLLKDVDKRYFLNYLFKIIYFIEQNRAYTNFKVFFYQVRSACAYYLLSDLSTNEFRPPYRTTVKNNMLIKFLVVSLTLILLAYTKSPLVLVIVFVPIVLQALKSGY